LAQWFQRRLKTDKICVNTFGPLVSFVNFRSSKIKEALKGTFLPSFNWPSGLRKGTAYPPGAPEFTPSF
jgi:hypothetical protein